jgi:acyl-CoA thioesterase-1
VRSDRRRWLAAVAAFGAAPLLALAGCGRKAKALACRLPADATVLAIGDSITRGHGADGAGYAEQLQALLAAPGGRPGVTVVNAGIDGERSEGLLVRIEAALAEHRPAVVLLTSGGNDFLRGVPEADTARHLRAVLERIRAAGAAPMLFAVPKPSLAAGIGFGADHPLYAGLAAAGEVLVLDGVVADVLGQPDLRSDQIHPNRAGYARMAQSAFEALQRCA